jgi:hypothetical protein
MTRGKKHNKEQNLIHIKASSLSYLYQGRGDYRGIYDIDLKGALCGVYRPFIEGPLQDR